jgi:hypothetical protein
MKTLHALEDLMTPLGNYKAYRSMMEDFDTSKPHIPIISLLLKDLLFGNDGNPTFVSPGMVNWEKLTNLYQRCKEVCKKRASYTAPVGLVDLVPCMEYCRSLRSLKEQALYKYSCLCEPKSGDDVLRLREKWMKS